MTIIGHAQRPGITNETGQRIVRRPIPTVFCGIPPEVYTGPVVVDGDAYNWPVKMPVERGPVQMRRGDYEAMVAAMEKLARFIDPDHPSCGVPSEVREAARIYLDSWVMGPLAAVKRHVESKPGTPGDYTIAADVEMWAQDAGR